MEEKKSLVDIVRRDLLRMAAMTGTAGILASLGVALDPTISVLADMEQRKGGAPAGDPNAGDLAIVNIAIQLEQKAVNTYEALGSAKLITNKDLVDVAKQFAADHTAHRDALIKAATDVFKGTPSKIEGFGTFPIPKEAIKKEVDAVRYALALEVIASKVYYDAFSQKLRTKAGRDLILTILPIETQHVGVFRSVLKLRLKDKELPDNDRLVPYSLLNEYPTPDPPQGFSWDIEKLG